MPSADAGDEPWCARVRDDTGEVLGAGVVLGGTHLLTCAHVVEGVDAVVVELPIAGVSARARVAPGRTVPPQPDERGDVALLPLDRAVRAADGAVLRWVAPYRGRTVCAFGFPLDTEHGVWASARLAGTAGPGAEWVQLDTLGDRRITAGFSGSAVFDDEHGDVLGIVVGRHTGESGLAWMIPVETIGRYLPEARRWFETEPPADASFTSGPVDGGDRVDLNHWLAHKPGGSVLVLVGAEVDALRRAVVGSSRESQPGRPGAPPLDSIDLAVDATGRTAVEVATRVLGRTGARVGGDPVRQVRLETPPMTLAVDGVDLAHDPERLLAGVLDPLAARGSRLIIGFREPGGLATRTRGRQPGGTAARRAQHTADLRALAAAEADLLRLAREAGAPPGRLRAASLRPALSPGAEVDLDDCAADIARAHRAVRAERERLERNRLTPGRERTDQRGPLDSPRPPDTRHPAERHRQEHADPHNGPQARDHGAGERHRPKHHERADPHGPSNGAQAPDHRRTGWERPDRGHADPHGPLDTTQPPDHRRTGWERPDRGQADPRGPLDTAQPPDHRRAGRERIDPRRERADLRGLLDATRAQVVDHGLAEDVDLDTRYREAVHHLAHSDLPRSRVAVSAYRRAVREAVEGDR
ncbi:trypsin-like peptidase domain-containing protein [Actinokineospora sp. PR83]|uniref:trypsin-like peptidase domain-containing protein n=1 Tax=Actinokineospora sp. PR83 TaxID=2884908 RepID=UPI001F265A36|nr:trypsin-like peptidase domain-containing protein [Actinokineospora sp. PR83]MCG8915703.1 trypsin-like peptidase domain-containing protein [Actinokineospora sp. PR83]